MRQNDIEKIIAYQKCFIGPLVWKCFTNNFELLLSEKEFPTFCTFFMYINVHGHQIFAKCTLNTPIARAVLDLGAVREGPYVNGKPRATGRATKFPTK